MNAVLDEMAEDTDSQHLAGQMHILRRWGSMALSTRELLTNSGYYDQRGTRLHPEDPLLSWMPAGDVDRLEWTLGAFKQCLAAKLPTRSEEGALIPVKALSNEVIEACNDLLLVPQWHDPEFLRCAILAMAAHEEAFALTMTPPKKKLSVAGPFFLGLFHLVLAFLVPYGLAAGLMAAMDHDIGSAVWSFYLVGVGLNSVFAMKEKNSKALTTHTKSPRVQDDMGGHFEYAYNAWLWFRLQHGIVVTGSAASFHIERMANEGINVPPVAFDLCRALSARTQSLAAGQS